MVKELSQRTEALKRAVEGKSKLIETARGVYAVTDRLVARFAVVHRERMVAW
jgi:hypothetical protein